jgi:hypothetical protein
MTQTHIVAEPGVPQIVITREFAAPRELLFRAHRSAAAGPVRQRHLARRRPGHPAGRDDRRGLRAASPDRGAYHVPDQPGGGPAHDQAGLRGDSDVRRLRDPQPRLGGLQVASGALESLRRSLACELGPHGIRVVTLQTGGIGETLPEGFPGRQAIVDGIEGRTMLGRGATLADVGHVAAFAASDHARSMTATALNITSGSVVD